MFPNVKKSLYQSKFEHDACGVGFVANVHGRKERRILDHALEALCNLAHRGALDADAKTGDGAGVMIQLPQAFFKAEAALLNGGQEPEEDIAVGFLFLPAKDQKQAATASQILEEAVQSFDMEVIGWREVPVQPKCLGDKALSTLPAMKQILVSRGNGWDDEMFERRLFLARKVAGQRAREEGVEDFYITSFSSKTIVYKGLFNAPQLAQFYGDLRSPLFETSLAVFHQRYSTPIPFRPGDWPTPIARWPITAKSTLCWGTRIGRGPVNRRSPHRFGEITLSVCARSSSRRVPTLRRSTMLWRSSGSVGETSFTACSCWLPKHGKKWKVWTRA